MTLWRSILQGLGWEVGKTVAREALARSMEKSSAETEAAPDPKKLEKDRKAAEAAERKARHRRAREARKEAKAQAKAVDRELKQLKRRIEKEDRP